MLKVSTVFPWLSRLVRSYLQDEAEVGWSSVGVFVVTGGVHVDLIEADEAGEVSGRLQDGKAKTRLQIMILSSASLD